MSETLRCPFCGAQPDIDTHKPCRQAPTDYGVCCMNPKCKVQPLTVGHDSEEEAIAAWNARADHPSKKVYRAGDEVPDGWYWVMMEGCKPVVVEFNAEMQAAWKRKPKKECWAQGPIDPPEGVEE